jgi:sorbitol-specific phosphotransferase system component IIBC
MEIFKDLLNRFWKPVTIIILLFVVCGCGSRKVNKSVIEQESKQETTTTILDGTKTTTNAVENTKIVDSSNTDEIEFIPVDNTKPMTINGKTYFNTILKHKKTKNNISVVKDKKVSQIEDKEVKTSIKDKKEESFKEDKKKIDKKPIPFWNFLLLLLFLGGVGYLIFIFLRKKRTDESK